MDPVIKVPQDAQLALQTAVTKTATFTSAALDLGDGRSFQSPGWPVQVVIETTALDQADENETYTPKLQQSADGDTWTDVATGAAITAVGVSAFNGTITQRYQRLVMTLAGTTPSITYNAFLNPIRGV